MMMIFAEINMKIKYGFAVMGLSVYNRGAIVPDPKIIP